MHDDIIEKSFGLSNNRNNVIKRTRMHRLEEERPKRVKIVIISPLTSSDTAVT